MKVMLDYLFIYKAKAVRFWYLIPRGRPTATCTAPRRCVPSTEPLEARKNVIEVWRFASKRQDHRDGDEGASRSAGAFSVLPLTVEESQS